MEDLSILWRHSRAEIEVSRFSVEGACSTLVEGYFRLFAQLLYFLRHNTSCNSWFTFIAIAGKRFLRLVVQTLVTLPFESLCLQLVHQSLVLKCLRLDHCSLRLDYPTTVDCILFSATADKSIHAGLHVRIFVHVGFHVREAVHISSVQLLQQLKYISSSFLRQISTVYICTLRRNISNTITAYRNGPAVCLWKFGLQCPASPLLPPRKVPLEDLIYTSCTDPIPQPAAARTPRLHQPLAVTHLFYAYVRKATNTEFNVVVLGRDLILYWPLILSILSVDCIPTAECASTICNVLQQFVQQLFAQLLSFLRHNTSRNSWFTFIAIAGKRCLRLVVQTLVMIPFESLCLQLVHQSLVLKCLRLDHCSLRLDYPTTG
ncbi:hypothetical protein F511_02169 [Dorcoceras hygrometricum]|uniref:Uncharacterized protein n=1 Tax=Dorcoceras hygrometricum TaxID=472368 RepID=A0A2Z7BJ36_9LAMI|nr:hypothetical protein F511_02169 [Dorcoceras hygrometricum]